MMPEPPGSSEITAALSILLLVVVALVLAGVGADGLLQIGASVGCAGLAVARWNAGMRISDGSGIGSGTLNNQMGRGIVKVRGVAPAEFFNHGQSVGSSRSIDLHHRPNGTTMRPLTNQPGVRDDDGDHRPARVIGERGTRARPPVCHI
jgi:hypothetical protein